MSEKIDYSKGIYDARQLGAGRMFILGVQHMFAMFGATVLVPLLTGLSVSTTPAVRRSGHPAVPPHYQKEGACIPRLLLCVSGRLLHRGPHAG